MFTPFKPILIHISSSLAVLLLRAGCIQIFWSSQRNFSLQTLKHFCCFLCTRFHLSMSSLVMRCPEVNTLFHLWINYICAERRLEHPAMWDVCVLPLKPNCPFSCPILLQFHLLGLCLPNSLLGWMHPQLQLLLGVWCGLVISPRFQFCFFFQKEKSLCDFDISFQLWQFGQGLLKRAGRFLGGPEWSEAPSQICDVPGNQSKTSFVCIYFSCLILQYISLYIGETQ